MRDILGNFLRVTPAFRGKWRLRKIWEHTVLHGERRIARLPDGSVLNVQLDMPYERMVWLEDEEWAELQYLRRKLRPGDVSDRKSTRLNSSHGYISYAVFCLKKKK